MIQKEIREMIQEGRPRRLTTHSPCQSHRYRIKEKVTQSDCRQFQALTRVHMSRNRSGTRRHAHPRMELAPEPILMRSGARWRTMVGTALNGPTGPWPRTGIRLRMDSSGGIASGSYWQKSGPISGADGEPQEIWALSEKVADALPR